MEHRLDFLNAGWFFIPERYPGDPAPLLDANCAVQVRYTTTDNDSKESLETATFSYSSPSAWPSLPSYGVSRRLTTYLLLRLLQKWSHRRVIDVSGDFHLPALVARGIAGLCLRHAHRRRLLATVHFHPPHQGIRQKRQSQSPHHLGRARNSQQ